MRRYELWNGPSSNVEFGSISRLSVELQMYFRVKKLLVFALLLLFVCVLVGACAYVPQVNEKLATAFKVFKGHSTYLVDVWLSVVVLLYFIRAFFPLNWLVLLLFSVV